MAQFASRVSLEVAEAANHARKHLYRRGILVWRDPHWDPQGRKIQTWPWSDFSTEALFRSQTTYYQHIWALVDYKPFFAVRKISRAEAEEFLRLRGVPIGDRLDRPLDETAWRRRQIKDWYSPYSRAQLSWLTWCPE